MSTRSSAARRERWRLMPLSLRRGTRPPIERNTSEQGPAGRAISVAGSGSFRQWLGALRWSVRCANAQADGHLVGKEPPFPCENGPSFSKRDEIGEQRIALIESR